MGFVAFTRPNLCLLDLSLLFTVLVGHNFVSGICKLKPKKPKFLFKNIGFFPSLALNTLSDSWLTNCTTVSRLLSDTSTMAYMNICGSVVRVLDVLPATTSYAHCGWWGRLMSSITSCAGGRHNMPRPRQVDLWPWMWCPSHVWRGLPPCQF